MRTRFMSPFWSSLGFPFSAPLKVVHEPVASASPESTQKRGLLAHSDLLTQPPCAGNALGRRVHTEALLLCLLGQ